MLIRTVFVSTIVALMGVAGCADESTDDPEAESIDDVAEAIVDNPECLNGGCGRPRE
jgi:hypothetical protein